MFYQIPRSVSWISLTEMIDSYTPFVLLGEGQLFKSLLNSRPINNKSVEYVLDTYLVFKAELRNYMASCALATCGLAV